MTPTLMFFSDLKIANDEIARLSAEIGRSHDAIDAANRENDALRARIEEFYGDDAATLRKEVERLKLEANEHRDRDWVAVTEALRARIAEQKLRLEVLTKEGVDLRAETERLDRLVKDKMGKNSTLRARIAELETLIADPIQPSLQAENDALRARIEELQGQLTEQTTELTNKCQKNLITQSSALLDRIAELEGALKRIDKLWGETQVHDIANAALAQGGRP